MNSIVAISTIGCKKNNRLSFMRGYNALLERINPEAILVFGSPFTEMKGNIIQIDYVKSREENRNGR